jgi:hypothetical protein
MANHQQQAIEDVFSVKPCTRTFYNKIGEMAKDFDYVHITAHGTADKLYFEHDIKQGEEAEIKTDYLIHQFNKQNHTKQLIVLVACSSELMAQTFVNKSITKAAIGTTIDISPNAAVAFTKQFYRELAHQSDIKTAFENTCFELNNDPYREYYEKTGEPYDYFQVFQLYLSEN